MGFRTVRSVAPSDVEKVVELVDNTSRWNGNHLYLGGIQAPPAETPFPNKKLYRLTKNVKGTAITATSEGFGAVYTTREPLRDLVAMVDVPIKRRGSVFSEIATLDVMFPDGLEQGLSEEEFCIKAITKGVFNRTNLIWTPPSEVTMREMFYLTHEVRMEDVATTLTLAAEEDYEDGAPDWNPDQR